MDYFYIKTSPHWGDLCKYGYVEGNETFIMNRTHHSIEEHPEQTAFLHLVVFNKPMHHSIDQILSHPTNTEIPRIDELREYFAPSKSPKRRRSTEFIHKKGVPSLLSILGEWLFPVKEYSLEELRTINETFHEGDLFNAVL
jgi:hypothetical protein